MMIGIVLGWGFASFLYFKIAIDAASHDSISVIASLLMAVIFSLLMFFITGVYALRLARYNVEALAYGPSLGKVIGRTILPFVAAVVGFLTISRLVVFGFSKDLSDEIDMFDYRGQLQEEFVVFALIVVIPVIVHYAMVVFSARRMAAE